MDSDMMILTLIKYTVKCCTKKMCLMVGKIKLLTLKTKAVTDDTKLFLEN